MKTFLLILFCATNSFAATDPQAVLLHDAVKQNIVLEPRINGAGGFNGKCILLWIKNKLKRKVKVAVEPGWTFIAKESRYQNMIVTDSLMIVLDPLEEKETLVFAMCTQSYDASPNSSTYYTLGDYAQEPLATLAHYIYQNKYQNSFGQSGVWSISNGLSKASIRGGDQKMVNHMKAYIERMYSTRKEANPRVQPTPSVPAAVQSTRLDTSRRVQRRPAPASLPTTEQEKKEYFFDLRTVHPDGGVPYAYKVRSKYGSLSVTLADSSARPIAEILKNIPVVKGSYREVVRIGDYKLASGEYKLIIRLAGEPVIYRKFMVDPNADTDRYNEFRGFLKTFNDNEGTGVE